jgi:hypothetical protein
MVKFVVIAFDDTWFKLSEGKILAYNYASLSEEDKKPESDYKPGALFYFSDLESLVPGMDSMLKQGESSSFMATDITVSENGTKAVIEGQQDAGMFFIPETLEFEVGVPTTNSTIFDSANPSQEFTLTPTAIYDTPEGLLNWRQEMDALKGKPLKAAETDFMKAEVDMPEKQIQSRKDYDIDNEVDIDDLEVGDIDLSPIEDEIVQQLNEEIVDAIKDSVDGELPLEDGETGSDSVDISTDITLGMDVPIEGTVSFDWTANENYEENPVDDDWAAETEKMSPCCEEPLIEREGIFCGACGENYGFSAETLEAEFVFNVADTSGETSDIHTYFVEAKDKDTAEEMLAVMIEDDYPGMSYEVMDVSMAEGYGTVSGYVSMNYSWETDSNEYDDYLDEYDIDERMEEKFQEALDRGETDEGQYLDYEIEDKDGNTAIVGVSGRFSAESEDFFSAEEMMALDELHMES